MWPRFFEFSLMKIVGSSNRVDTYTLYLTRIGMQISIQFKQRKIRFFEHKLERNVHIPTQVESKNSQQNDTKAVSK